MERIAVFAGSFDPFTLAHLSIARNASDLFDRLVILVAKNERKRALLSENTRVRFIEMAVADLPNVQVEAFDGLTVDYLKNHGARFLVRGIHSASEFDVERALAWNNAMLYPEAQTVFLSVEPELAAVSSSAVREILQFGGDVSKMVPAAFLPDLLLQGSAPRCSE